MKNLLFTAATEIGAEVALSPEPVRVAACRWRPNDESRFV
jgi:hypothetical protein